MTANAECHVASQPNGPAPCITCAGCGTARERPATGGGGWRVPAGWKRLHDRFWCPTCKRQRFVLRAIALPVSGPADATWPELRVALHTAFGETTRCANWLVTQFYARDRQREPGDVRLPAMPRVYLYPEARTLFPSLASQTLASLEQQVLARYRAARLALVWRHAVSLPTYRYPTPLPLPARMWKLERQNERWHLSVRIGDRRWSLRLRHGPGMGRQIRVLRQVAAGTVEAGEAALYEIPAHRGDHRSESTPARRLMVKVAVWLARRDASAVDPVAADTASAPTPTARVLIVRTASDAFLTAHLAAASAAPIGDDGRAMATGFAWHLVPGDARTLQGERVSRWLADAARRHQHLHEDLARKEPYEQAPLASVVNLERQRAARLRRRLRDWTHQAAAMVIAWARRGRATTIVWDDRVRGYLPTYPWQQFVTTLSDKAAIAGMRVLLASRATADDEISTTGHLQAESPSKAWHAGRPGPLQGTRTSAGDSWAKAQAPPGRSERSTRQGSDSPRDAAVDSKQVPGLRRA